MRAVPSHSRPGASLEEGFGGRLGRGARRSDSPRAGELRRREGCVPSAWQSGFFCPDERGPVGFILKSQPVSDCTVSALTCGDFEFDSP